MQKKVYCALKDFSPEARELLNEAGFELVVNGAWDAPNGDELIDLLSRFDIVITGVATKYTQEILSTIDCPKLIASFSVGLDHIAPEFFRSNLVKIVNIKTANAEAVAEHIFALMLALNKRIDEGYGLVLTGRGHKKNLIERPRDLCGQTLGLIGAGSISQEVARIAQAFNMRVLCYTRNPELHRDLAVEFVGLDEVLAESDVVNVSLPLNNETRGLISSDKLSLLKKRSTFINTSRAEVVDMEALFARIDTNENFYVGLDIDVDQYKKLIERPRRNVIITPHTAGVSEQAIYNMDLEIARKIIEEFM